MLRVSRAGLALGLALTLAGLGPGAPVVRAAANDLAEGGSVTYTVDPAAGAVHAALDMTESFRHIESPGGYYYFSIYVFVEPEATAIHASDSAGPLKVATKPIAATKGYLAGLRVEVSLRHHLLFGQSTKFHLTWDLKGAARSSSTVRVDGAFVTFLALVFGDAGHAASKIILPPGFEPQELFTALSGSTLPDGRTVLTLTPSSTPSYDWSLIEAERSAGYTSRTVPIGAGRDIVVQGFPEDAAWLDHTTQILAAALPAIAERTGLTWPLANHFTIRERFVAPYGSVPGRGDNTSTATRLSLGYGPKRDLLAVSESTDDMAITSQVATAWFGELFTDRWISAGLGEEYAAQALNALKHEPLSPGAPDRADPGALSLSTWSLPVDQRTLDLDAIVKLAAERERYGANASWYVLDEVITDVGPDRMKQVLAAAATGATAYPGTASPETVGQKTGWRRFLDLVDDIGTSTKADGILRDQVLAGGLVGELGDRTTARQAYEKLVTDGRGWLAPFLVRRPMGEWDFKAAQAAMTEARKVLDLRDRVEAAAKELGLTPGGSLKAAYEGATDGVAAAQTVGQAELDALAALKEARARLDAAPDLVTSIGLIGASPRTSYSAAEQAYEMEDLAGVMTSTAAVKAILAGAGDVGRQRLLAGAAAIVVLVVILLLLAFRRRRRRRRLLALAAASLTASAADPGSTSPDSRLDATLAPDPGPDSNPEAGPDPTSPSDAGQPSDGGDAAGEPSAGAT